MSDNAAIGSVPLYTHLERIDRGLAALGIGPSDPIQPEQLFHLDQWHYHGTEAIRAAAEHLGLGPTSRVLDIGSGLGGPARYLAHTTGCQITALELQPELHLIATDLTRRCGLGKCVTHLCGDALSYPILHGAFDAVVSWLAILHISDRLHLFGRLARALRPGGICYIEDLCMRAPFVSQDLDALRNVVFGITVTSTETYTGDLQAAGFVGITATDMTGDWAPYARTRLAMWQQDRAIHIQIGGEAAYAAQERFYLVIARLYESGSLGGVRIVARAP